MDKLNFIKINSDDLKKSDKRGLATLYLYWLENGKKSDFDLPLFISDDGKGVLNIETFKRIFYAFQVKINHFCSATIKSGNDGDDNSYNIVNIKVDFKNIFNLADSIFNDYIQPKKADVKRESSKITSERVQAKKELEQKKVEAEEKELNEDWNKKAVKELSKYLVTKFKIKTTELNSVENDILRILNNIQ